MPAERYADIILPLAVKGRFTYSIPSYLVESVVKGSIVRVPFGRGKLITGVVADIHTERPDLENIRDIKSPAEDFVAVNDIQLQLWRWMSEYYMCSEGEVMKAALPGEITADSYSPRMEVKISLSKNYSDRELTSILDSLSRAPKQQTALSEYLRLSEYEEGKEIIQLSRIKLISESKVSLAAIEALAARGILRMFKEAVSRFSEDKMAVSPLHVLNSSQEAAYESIQNHFEEKDIVLLHGVTSSGKTEIYTHLIDEQIKKGRQVLYMLPEIALTTQIITRLKKHFGEATGIYHSKLSDSERAEMWKRVSETGSSQHFDLVLGVRSSVFLPFSNLGLIIIDEEHDSSYKQHDPAPRYHARDSAIMLASMHKAKTLLGSASPSVETYNNSLSGKYGLSELKERFGFIRLPEIILANTREAYRKKMMVSHFTPELLNAIDVALGREEQVILFQNRRGFSPYIECSECGWIPVCVQCAVSLTYHKGIGRLVCHYCGYTENLPSKCGSCHTSSMVTKGFGTEKIEDEIKIVFPDARVARMDQDTTKGKNAFNKIIRAFEDRQIDILIGTQMISKGLDFENLTVVGILNADNLLNHPDFRAYERSFQLMEQVSGRAGRRQKQGKVIIQTSDTANRIIRLVVHHDYAGLFAMQAEERKQFNYPPFSRMVRINLKHKDLSQLNIFAAWLGKELKAAFGRRVLGPESPVISRVQFWYIKTIIIKVEREKPPAKAKKLISEAIERLYHEKGTSSLRVAIDVDPY